MSLRTHPKDKNGPGGQCPECGAANVPAGEGGRDEPYDNWEQGRDLPQVGRTWICKQCGEEVYVYNTTAPGKPGPRKWRPVTPGMVRELLFFDNVGDWPDRVFEHPKLPLREFPRAVAIDFWMVEHEDYSQSEWADEVGISQQAVSKNVAKVRDELPG